MIAAAIFGTFAVLLTFMAIIEWPEYKALSIACTIFALCAFYCSGAFLWVILTAKG